MENLLPQCGVNYQLLAVKQPNGELPIAVGHSQLSTMASETIDPINRQLLPTLHKSVLLKFHLLHGANEGYKSQDLLQPVRRENATFGMPGQRAACAATQLIKTYVYVMRFQKRIVTSIEKL